MKTIQIDYSNSGIAVGTLFLISIIAFWPSYYAVFFDSQFYVHFHAFTATVWFALLIVQPILIRKRKLELHRLFGKISFPVAGLVIISVLLLAHNRISTSPEELYSLRTYILYLQLSLTFVFAVTYGLAIYFRKIKAIHARLMVATALTFIDPVFARIINTTMPSLDINGQWLTFGTVMLILFFLSVIDRNNRKAKWVFPGLLLLYMIIAIPIYFDLTGLDCWQSFAAWFASI